MERKIDVNWVELKKIGDNTNDYYVELEEIRNRISEIISSIEECWSGIDAKNFIDNSKGYLNTLDRKLKKMEEWSKYFNRSSLKYSAGVQEGERRIKNVENELQNQYSSRHDEVI